MDKQDVIKKIQKCLALSKSSNEHEAAAALRQAQKLMEMHRVTDADLFIAGAAEASAAAGARRQPAAWEARLAAVVAAAFGCAYIFVGLATAGKWVFVGLGPNAEVASYACDVLLRQLRRSRATFIKGECKRLVPASKTRRADLFCSAWVTAAASKIHALAEREEDEKVITAYLESHYPSLGEMELVNRNANRKLREKDRDAVLAGAAAGAEVQLSHAVGPAADPVLLG
jgi:hypothetical protein